MAQAEEQSLQGWDPILGDEVSLEDAIDLAFDYRGDVTVTAMDGSCMVGYVSNRDSKASPPFIELFPASGGDPITIPYADVTRISFTGKDTAAGQSYEAYQRRKGEAKQTGGQ